MFNATMTARRHLPWRDRTFVPCFSASKSIFPVTGQMPRRAFVRNEAPDSAGHHIGSLLVIENQLHYRVRRYAWFLPAGLSSLAGTRTPMPPKFLLLLAVFPLYQAWDLYQLGSSGPSFHFYVETAATIAFLGVLYSVICERRRALQAFETLKHSADASARAVAERDAAAQQSTRDFLQSMQEQFERWALTPAERDVALLLVKGLSLEEIAGVRETGAKTVRQHAANLYAKAKVNGRHQLAAFFFEDLLAPRPSRES